MAEDVPSSMKRFVTEKELEEVRQRRQEEWEKARQARPNLPAPDSAEAASSGKTLYEQLQLQKMKKEEEFTESHKFKNMIRGLDDDESAYLDAVSRKQMAADRSREKEQEELVTELRKQQASQLTTPVISTDVFSAKKDDKPKSQPPQNTISSLVKQAVKRKPESSLDKPETEPSPVKQAAKNGGSDKHHPVVRVIGVLPSIVPAYADSDNEGDGCESDSDDSSSCSSDSDECEVECDGKHSHKGDDLASFRPSIAPALVRRIRREMADGDD